MSFARELGFTPRVLLVHDRQGQLKLKPDEVKAFERIVDTLPKSWMDFSSYRKRLVHDGSALSNAAPAAAIFTSMNLEM